MGIALKRGDMKEPCSLVLRKAEERDNQHRILLSRLKLVASGICPDCGADLVRKRAKISFWKVQRMWDQFCPIHGKVAAGAADE